MNRFKKETKQLSIFVTAGYPELGSLQNQVLSLQEKGVDFIEIGIPFSDPMADGEKIQQTSSIAIENGMNINILFEQLAQFKDKIEIPLVMMSYFNPIFTFGLGKFLSECQNLKIQHVIIPDISLEVYERNYKSDFEKYGITLCFLITPNSENDRILKMAKYSKNGFVYLVSQNSTTGSTNKNETDLKLKSRYKEIKKICQETPLMIGFGIKNKVDLKMVQEHASGGIIGTAYLNAISENSEKEFIESLIC
jgi:tryptophan synthase alpha chain